MTWLMPRTVGARTPTYSLNFPTLKNPGIAQPCSIVNPLSQPTVGDACALAGAHMHSPKLAGSFSQPNVDSICMSCGWDTPEPLRQSCPANSRECLHALFSGTAVPVTRTSIPLPLDTWKAGGRSLLALAGRSIQAWQKSTSSASLERGGLIPASADWESHWCDLPVQRIPTGEIHRMHISPLQLAG